MKMTAGYPTIHPSDRHIIRVAIDGYHRNGRDSFEEKIAKFDPELNTDYFNWVYSSFLRYEPTRDDEVSFVLKCCDKCFDGTNHSHCFIEQQSWVWKEAIRRGDDDLFVPIIEAHPSEGWLIMLDAHNLGALPEIPDTGLSIFEKGRNINTIADCLIQELRERGWSIEDVEPMAAPDRTGKPRAAIIDYEYVYPEDIFHPLYHQSFDHLVGWDDYTDRTKEEIRKHYVKLEYEVE